MQRPVDSVTWYKDTVLRVRPSCVMFLFQVVWRSTNELRWAEGGLVLHYQWLIFSS